MGLAKADTFLKTGQSQNRTGVHFFAKTIISTTVIIYSLTGADTL